MSTRATVRFATREEGVPFNEHPKSWHAQFYNHHDGYPEGLGVEIAESFTNYGKIQGWEVEGLNIVHADIEYMYYIWQCQDDDRQMPWISIFETRQWNDMEGECIFVGTPDMLLKKYGEEMENPEIEDEQRSLCDDDFLCEWCDEEMSQADHEFCDICDECRENTYFAR